MSKKVRATTAIHDVTTLHDSLTLEFSGSPDSAPTGPPGSGPGRLGGGRETDDERLPSAEAQVAGEGDDRLPGEGGEGGGVDGDSFEIRPAIPSSFVGPGVWIIAHRQPEADVPGGPTGTFQNKLRYVEHGKPSGSESNGGGDPGGVRPDGERGRLPLDFVGPGVWSLPRQRPKSENGGDPDASPPRNLV